MALPRAAAAAVEWRRRQAPPGCLWLPLLVLVLTLPHARPCQAQMQSPLKGAGLPPLETTEIFVSAYLDRLLRIDEEGYVWEAVMYFYISWYDPSAYAQVAANTERMWTDPTYVCKRPCSTEADQFTPDDSASTGGASVDAQGWTSRGMKAGSVVREVRVHGSFYQPMSFQNFPFESFDLLLELRLMDPTKMFTNNTMLLAPFHMFTNNTTIYGAHHPGVTMQPSSAGLRLWTLGRGDDTASWRAADIRLERFQGSMSSWFRENSLLPSHPRDPNPLKPLAQQGASANAGGYRDTTDQILGVFITVERFWKPSLINVVLPILLVFMLGMAVFVIDKSRLDIRLEVVVALFLSLTTAQFTIQSHVPTSSYLVPTTQLLLATYCFLFLVSLESIFVFYVLRWRPMRELGQHRQHAARRYSQLRVESGQRRGLARFSVFGVAETQRSSVAWHTTPPPPPQQQQQQQRQAGQHGADSMERAWHEYLAHHLDRIAAVTLGLGYSIATILIFTLQSGYIDLFAENSAFLTSDG
ncbi:ligand-gated ion channel [Chlorella sorokiniana]|uniref:Ligand-gated ion channel n=1 Tax=Chlorella sorokiniana TaxID=3076 RepID=A0A2P6TV16_CHLSO|nr:ligand-gated ion channel [Chlorella sorokiniana]|eukprot:PRW57913.1 ligand-gated ion channel [Chlorella sorokiniana]